MLEVTSVGGFEPGEDQVICINVPSGFTYDNEVDPNGTKVILNRQQALELKKALHESIYGLDAVLW